MPTRCPAKNAYSESNHEETVKQIQNEGHSAKQRNWTFQKYQRYVEQQHHHKKLETVSLKDTKEKWQLTECVLLAWIPDWKKKKMTLKDIIGTTEKYK